MKLIKHQRGISLVEVVAAIVIIGIILISFSQLFIQSNKVAYKNNERLVTIQLADAMLARLKAESFPHNNAITNLNDYFIDRLETEETKKRPPTVIKMNEKSYTITYRASQSNQNVDNSSYSEKDLKLVKVIVTVTAPDGKTKGSSEGYVALE